MQYDAGLCYKPCDFGYHGVGPVCWSDCARNQVDCGAGCGRSSEECAAEIVGQVLGPLIVAANVATLGLSAPATNTLQTITVARKVVAGTSRLGKSFVRLVKELQTIEKVPDGAKGALVLRTKTDPLTGQLLNKELTRSEILRAGLDLQEEYKKMFAEDFASQTSPEINAAIENHFTPFTAEYIKGQWAMVEMKYMAEANNWNTAGLALLAASVADPTGVTDLISAYAKPTCLINKPFPQTAADKDYKRPVLVGSKAVSGPFPFSFLSLQSTLR